MATIAQVRTAIATAVGTVSGLRTASLVPDKINPPLAVVWRKTITFDESFHGPTEAPASEQEFGVTVYVQRASERSGQDLLDAYAEPSGATSIKAAVETNAALRALVSYALVTTCEEVTVVTIGVVDYLAEVFTVLVCF